MVGVKKVGVLWCLGISSQKGWLDIDRKLYMYGWVSYSQVFEIYQVLLLCLMKSNKQSK